MLELTKDEREAKAWAVNQNFQSVAARYSKTLAGALRRAQDKVSESEFNLRRAIETMKGMRDELAQFAGHRGEHPETDEIIATANAFIEAHGGGHGPNHA